MEMAVYNFQRPLETALAWQNGSIHFNSAAAAINTEGTCSDPGREEP